MNKKFSTVLRWGLPAPFAVLAISITVFASLYLDIYRWMSAAIFFVCMFLLGKWVLDEQNARLQGLPWRETFTAWYLGYFLSCLALGLFLLPDLQVFLSEKISVTATVVTWESVSCGPKTRAPCSKVRYAYHAMDKDYEETEKLSEEEVKRAQGDCFSTWGMRTRPSEMTIMHLRYLPFFSQISDIKYQKPLQSFRWASGSSIMNEVALLWWCWYVPWKWE